ncbi:MAG: N-acyl amino acid synthase FeeM domain-containing protein [Rhizobiaceae bacterium]
MSTEPGKGQTLSDRIAVLMPVVECRNLVEPEDREAAFRLRYEAYRREDRIPRDAERLSYDFLDDMPNAQTFGVFVAGKLACSIRLNIVTTDCPHSISMVSNRELLESKLTAGITFIDPSRFVIDPKVVCGSSGSSHLTLPYLTMKIPVMACRHFDVDECLTLARREHHPFYRRIFRAKPIAEPVHLKMLNMQVQLLSSQVDGILDELDRRYPFFRSSYPERRQLFGRREDMIGFEIQGQRAA